MIQPRNGEAALQPRITQAVITCPGVTALKGKGVVVQWKDDGCHIDLHIQASYGIPLRPLGQQLQQVVAHEVKRYEEHMHVMVHVTIEDIRIPD